MEIRIDGTAEMKTGESRVFEFSRKGRNYQAFLIFYRGSHYAYLNQCSHWLVPLDLGDADFYYDKADRITCKTHGATFEPHTGFCDYGPCFGATLISYPVQTAENHVLVIVPD